MNTNKAPDKIYIKGFSGGISQVWSRIKATETSADEQYEYIRKEALMEWANGWLAFKRSGVVLDDGFSYAMEELIKKLNEM